MKLISYLDRILNQFGYVLSVYPFQIKFAILEKKPLVLAIPPRARGFREKREHPPYWYAHAVVPSRQGLANRSCQRKLWRQRAALGGRGGGFVSGSVWGNGSTSTYCRRKSGCPPATKRAPFFLHVLASSSALRKARGSRVIKRQHCSFY